MQNDSYATKFRMYVDVQIIFHYKQRLDHEYNILIKPYCYIMVRLVNINHSIDIIGVKNSFIGEILINTIARYHRKLLH